MKAISTRAVVFIAACVVASAEVAVAAPSITGSSGTVAQDSSVVISGTGFGNKSPAAPLKYDDFQDGVAGNTLSTGTPPWNLWSNVQPAGDIYANYPKYSDSETRFTGDMCARQYFHNTADGYVSNCTIGLTDLGSDPSIYVSGWFFDDRSDAGASTGARNWKPWHHCVGAWGYPTTRYDVYPQTGGGHIYSDLCSEGGQGYNVWEAPHPEEGGWHRFEMWHDRGNYSGSEYQALTVDNVLLSEGSGPSRTSCPEDRIYINTYYDHNTGSNDTYLDRHWSELYIDNTWARVEIGDAQTFSSCTHCEIQIPSAWSATEITVTCNQGTFSADETAYLFVIDEDGTASSGYEITWGSDTPIGPATPDPVDSLWVIDQ